MNPCSGMRSFLKRRPLSLLLLLLLLPGQGFDVSAMETFQLTRTQAREFFEVYQVSKETKLKKKRRMCIIF